MSELFEGVASQSLDISVITADRDYGKETYVQLVSSIELSSIFVMLAHLWKVCPLVASSLFAPGRDEDDDSGATENTNEVDGNLQSFPPIIYDRRSSFVTQYAQCHGQARFTDT